jgi:poly-beta-1,6-N-acetyl-D-glucosamine N-deacetylase
MKNIRTYFNILIYRIIRFTLIPLMLRELIQRNYISIFYLHELKADQVREVLSFLNKKYNIIPLRDYIFRDGYKKFPGKPAIITIDDGFVSNYELLPILLELKMTCTIFVCTGIINTNRHFWFSEINSKNLIENFKKLENDERKERLFNDYGFREDKEYADRQALNKHEIEEMSSIVDFQPHTVFHPILPTCNDDEAFREIFNSKHYLEKEYGYSVYAFSYPNGTYTSREIDFVKKSDYQCAVTTYQGYNSLDADKYRLKRISLHHISGIDELCIKASGLYWILKHMYYYFMSIFNSDVGKT